MNEFFVRFCNAGDFEYFQADVIVTQRTAVPSIRMVKRLLSHCRKMGARLVYDLDDDLSGLHSERSEFAAYEKFKSMVCDCC